MAAHDVDFGLPPPEALDVTFAYLGGGLNEQRTHADTEWVGDARASLDSLTRSISAEEFTETPGPWCRSCDFLQFCGPGQTEMARR